MGEGGHFVHSALVPTRSLAPARAWWGPPTAPSAATRRGSRCRQQPLPGHQTQLRQQQPKCRGRHLRGTMGTHGTCIDHRIVGHMIDQSISGRSDWVKDLGTVAACLGARSSVLRTWPLAHRPHSSSLPLSQTHPGPAEAPWQFPGSCHPASPPHVWLRQEGTGPV